ncbi:CCA tRNA nucleotidyltransferase, partial [Candidatus Woesebacteria bacterium]|nr:CCA tRNA nucleotidyltransferase [Candidatus Woesebacteria bacterium]
EAYIVGGAIRDLLMGKLVYDWDFTTNATPDEILKIFDADDAYYTNDFGTVGIPSKIEGERPYEITTFRTEQGYSDSRRPDKISWGKTLEEDLKRRDFTVNAMALGKVKNQNGKEGNFLTFTLSPSCSFTFQLTDPYEGQKDIEKKLIRAVGDPRERFSEDALRMMRSVRIASQLGFKIEKKTKDAIIEFSRKIHNISKERVRDELLKTLASPNPYNGMKIFREVGLMKEVLPEFEQTFGVEQKSPGRHHIYDVGTHSMRALKFAAEKNPDPLVRLATLLHDIGKPKTYKKLDSGTITFYGHEVVGGRMAKNIAKRLRFSKIQAEKFFKLVRYHLFTVNEDQTDSAIRRFIRKVDIENVPDMLDLRTGDRLGGGAAETSWRLEEFKKRLVEVQKQPFTVHDLKISGDEVMEKMNLKPGPEVGDVLDDLYEKVVEKKVPNQKEALLSELKKIAKK